MKFIKAIIILLLLIGVLLVWISEPTLSSVDHKIVHSRIDGKTDRAFKLKADSILQNAMNLNDFIGVSTAGYSPEFGLWQATAGLKDKSKSIPPDPNTQFRIASIVKPMTAVAIMQLREKGKLNLNDRIGIYFPELKDTDKGEITITQLLKHTSGVRHYHSTLEAVSYKQYNTMRDAMEKFIHDPLEFEPGTQYLYSTYGYSILGAIIESVASMPYGKYMEDNVWGPAGMTNTELDLAEKNYENKARLYVKWKGHYFKSPQTNLSVKYSAGGMLSTATDLIKFGQAIINQTLIDSTSLDLMIHATDTLKNGTPYGFGWFVRQTDDHGVIIEHTGAQSGSSSFLKIYLDKKIVTTAIANNFNSGNEVYFLTKELGSLFINPSRKINYVKQIGTSNFNHLEGDYFQENKKFSIHQKDNKLFGQLHPYSSLEIYPNSSSQFFYRYFDGVIDFKKSQQHEDTLIYRYESKVDTFIRIP